MASVFISYAREDAEFARRLTACLKDQALESWIDWEDIPPTVDWWQEIEKGIEESDIFLFLLSPESTTSDVCRQEVAHAVQNHKRLIPLVVREINWDVPVPHLSQLNFIFFREEDDFDSALQKLLAAIRTDFEWVQQHRWLQVRALDWQRKGRDPGSLLRGRDLANAEFQLAQNSSREPYPTDLQRRFVLQSRIALERQRRSFTWLSAAVTLVMAGLAVFGFYQARTATERADQILSRQLALQARSLAESKGSMQLTAVLLAIRSAQLAPSAEALEVLQTSILATPVSMMKDAGAVISLAYSPDGKYVASGSYDGTVVWEAQTGREVARFDRNGGVNSVAFSPDSRYVASGGYNQMASIREVSTGRLITRQIYEGVVFSVLFSPDGRYLASTHCERQNGNSICTRGKAHILEVPSGQEIASMDSGGNTLAIAFSPNGRYLAAGGCDELDVMQACIQGTARLWLASTGREVARMTHKGQIFALAFSPNGKTILTAGGDGTIRLWDSMTGKELSHMEQQGAVTSAAISPDGKYVASGGSDNTVRVWEASTEREMLQMLHERGVTAVAYDPSSRYLLSGSVDGTARLWEAGTGRELARMSHEGLVQSVAFSRDGRYAVSGSWDGTVRVWRAEPAGTYGAAALLPGNKVEASFRCEEEEVAPDGFSICHQSLAVVQQTGTGMELARFHSDPERLWTVVNPSPDGKYFAAADNQAIHVWEIGSSRRVARIPREGWITALAFSPNGHDIVSASGDPFSVVEDFTAQVWEVGSGKQLIEVKHEDPVIAVGFSEDGKYVASATCNYVMKGNTATCTDSQVRVWEALTGTDVARWATNSQIYKLAFSQDDRYVITGEDESWLWRSEDLILEACRRASRNLTMEEWKSYMGSEPYQAICPNLPMASDVPPTATRNPMWLIPTP